MLLKFKTTWLSDGLLSSWRRKLLLRLQVFPQPYQHSLHSPRVQILELIWQLEETKSIFLICPQRRPLRALLTSYCHTYKPLQSMKPNTGTPILLRSSIFFMMTSILIRASMEIIFSLDVLVDAIEMNLALLD